MTIIDAHSHLWLRQDTWVDGKRVLSKDNGRSIFMDEEVQMLPPFMVDSKNTAEIFLANMNYAQVGGAVVVQEIIDGNQNDYLRQVQSLFPERFFCMGMAFSMEEAQAVSKAGLKGIAFPAHRIRRSLHGFMPIFKMMENKRMVLSICLGDDEHQIGEMREIIQECPDLKVAIGHFGMVTTPSFKSDYPRTITAITYRMSYDFVQKTTELSDKEKSMFLGDNAKRFYGFKNLPTLPYIKNMSE